MIWRALSAWPYSLVASPAAGVSLRIFANQDLSGDPVQTLTVAAEPGAPGTVSAQYSVASQGQYWLAAYVGDDLILGAPFRLDISPTPAPRLSGAELSASLLQIDVSFDMVSRRSLTHVSARTVYDVFRFESPTQ